MASYDVFNGDADGLCALQQLRLAMPKSTSLVTGAKRDIALLEKVHASTGDTVTVLDISLDRNRKALERILDAGAKVSYFDHHFAGEIPRRPNLTTWIDTAPDVCTAALVDRFLDGRFRVWAAAAAYGDGLTDLGDTLARQCGCDLDQATRLQALGELLNYNAYGESIDDLHFDPAELHCLMLPYADPLAFAEQCPAFAELSAGYEEDTAAAERVKPARRTGHSILLALPDEPWARRMTGPLANQWAKANPDRALAVLTPRRDGTYTISIRAPRSRPTRAAELAREFGGGGREAAAGIDTLPAGDIERFAGRFEQHFAP